MLQSTQKSKRIMELKWEHADKSHECNKKKRGGVDTAIMSRRVNVKHVGDAQ